MRNAMAVFIAGLILSMVAVVPDLARAEPAQPAAGSLETDPIGKVVTVKGSATIEHTSAVVLQANVSAGAGQAKVGEFVYRGDIVQTAANSALGVTFTDGTTFNIASNARLVLNEFVYDPKGKSNSALFSLTKGTITFVAGQVAKTGDMKVDTPVATMGIRGTTPHVSISDDGSVSFATLPEDNRPKPKQRRGDIEEKNKQATAPKQGKSKGAASKQAEKDADKNINFQFNICRGC